MKALVTLVLALFATTAFADESFSKIRTEKALQQNLSQFQAMIAGSTADDAFRAKVIAHAIEAHQKQMVAFQGTEEMKRTLDADHVAKIDLMRSIDPKTLQEMMIADLQEVQTSGVYVFALTQFVVNDYINWGKYGSVYACHECGAIIGTIFFPVVIALDLAMLPITLLLSGMTGF